MSVHQPAIGDWYRLRGGELFEVVAVDESDGTIEVQYFDGTLEEMEFDDWRAQFSAGEIEEVEAPEDWTGSVDLDSDAENAGTVLNNDRRLNASGGGLDDLDLFEQR